ncbi:MAG TPA: NUDIX domain-containing protein [Bacteroidales bacterium]|nr:NUDIX domain-containing protein [Bacteroidales bacterium]
MYKVFYYDKLIILTGKKNRIFPSDSDVVIDYQKYKDFEDAIEWFLTEKKTNRLIVHTRNLKALKIHFFSLFKRVEAAGGLVVNDRGDLLVIKRLDLWDLPKGKVEKNERKKDAARREVLEETGVKATITGEKPLKTYHIYPRGQKVILKTTYWYEMKAENDCKVVPQSEEQIEEVRWIKPEEIREYFSKSYHSLKELILHYFGTGV